MLELPYSLKLTNPVPVDANYNAAGVGYVTLGAACAAVVQGVRYAGLTVLVGKPGEEKEYWWLGNNLSNDGLVLKGAGAVNNGGASAPEPVFTQDILVSLEGGRSFGRFADGETIPAKGKTAQEVIRMAAISTKYPTYDVAYLGLGQSAPGDGEIGESLDNNVVSTFYQRDAGAISSLAIYKNGALLGAASPASPLTIKDRVTRTANPVIYSSLANYAAGPLKNLSPDNTPDPRQAQVQNSYAPQAAQNGLGSNQVVVYGHYRVFMGAVAAVPTTGAQVRNLPLAPLTSQGYFGIDSGTALNTFVIALPPGLAPSKIIDNNALGADLTASYKFVGIVKTPDAGGNLVDYSIYAMQSAAPYSSNHYHTIYF